MLTPRDDATSWCAADGRVGWLRSALVLAQLIGRINAGRRIVMEDALDLTSAASDQDLVTQVLEMLAAWRAVTVARS